MYSLDGNQETWTYLGLIDDRVAKYNWEGMKEYKRNQFLHAIKMAALFEDRVLINDGYLVNDMLRDEIINSSSLLRQLMKNGRVSILSKRTDGRLDLMFEDLAGNIPTYEHLVSSRAWPEIKEGLIETVNSEEYQYLQWPDIGSFDNRIGFDKIVEDIEGGEKAGTILEKINSADWRNVFNTFKEERGRRFETGSRSIWEEVVSKLDDPLSRNRLMNIANEVYHYNLAMALGAANNSIVNVSTIASKNLCSAKYAVSGDPLLQVNQKMKINLARVTDELFIDLINTTKKERKAYRRELMKQFSKPDQERVEDKINEYCDAIISWYRVNALPGELKFIDRNKSKINNLAEISSFIGAVVGDTAGLISGSVSFFLSKIAIEIPHFYAAWNVRGLKGTMKTKRFKPHDIDKIYTGTFIIDPQIAQSHIERSI